MKTKREGRWTPKDAKRFIGVARVLAPAVAPIAMRAAASARAGYDRMRAHRLGVPVDDLGSFTGRGAAMHARLAGDREALRGLAGRLPLDTEEGVSAERFAEEADRRLTDLATALRAAERMPASRRRSTHRVVAAELDRIEEGLLQHLRLRGVGG